MDLIAGKKCYYRGRYIPEGEHFSAPRQYARPLLAMKRAKRAPERSEATYSHRAIRETPERVDMVAYEPVNPERDTMDDTHQPVAFSPLDHDQDGRPGGSLPHDLPVLAGKNKAALLAIAEDEGVAIPEGATNREIRDAIEAARQ